MLDFFNANLDYVYFVYGLAFICLAAVSFTLKKDKKQGFPWIFLGFFGLIHGIHEWIDLLVIALGEFSHLAFLRLTFLFLSYLFLLYFAVKSYAVLNQKPLKLIYFIPLILFVFLGCFLGQDGFNVFCRYFLGFPAGVFSALAIFRISRSNVNGKFWLKVLSFSMLVYAIATGLIVPKIDFLLGRWINYLTFARIMGYPVQVLRCFLAGVSAIALWSYAQSFSSGEFERRALVLRRRMTVVMVFVLLTILALGWILVFHLSEVARKDIKKESLTTLELLVSHLNNALEKAAQAAKAMSGSPGITQALVSRTPDDIEKINLELDRYKDSLGVSVCYLLDNEGMTIASSNRNNPDSFVGKSYKFREYFIKPASGVSGDYFALGITSGRRGYYFGYPVKNSEAKIIGVVVAKVDLDNIEAAFNKYPWMFFIDPHGVIFLSSRKDLLFKFMWPVDKTVQKQILDSRQFLDKPFSGNSGKPLFSERFSNQQEIFLGNERLYAIQSEINHAGWVLAMFTPLHQVEYFRFYGIILVLVLSILVIFLFMAFRHQENLYLDVFEANSKFKAVLDATSQVAIVAVDNNGLITVFNIGAEKMLGYSAKEVVGISSLVIFTIKSDLLKREKELSVEFGRPVQGIDVFFEYPKLGRIHQGEWFLVTKDGRQIITDLSVAAQQDSSGRICGYIVVVKDITERKKAEKALRISEKRYRMVIQNAGNMIVGISSNMEILEWNDEAQRLSGYDRKQVFGKNYLDLFVLPEHREEFLLTCRKVFSGSVVRDYEVPMKFAEEGLSIISWTISCLYDDNNMPYMIIAIGQDITLRRRMEDQLRESQRQITTMISNLPGMVYRCHNDKDWSMEFISQGCLSLTGYQPVDIIDNKNIAYSQIIHPDDRERVWDTVQSALANRTQFQCEYRIVSASGDLKWVWEQGRGVLGAQNELLAIEGVVMEVTSRKAAEEALSESRNFLDKIINSIPDPIFVKDTRHNWVLLNDAFCDFIGHKREMLIGKSDYDFFPKEQADVFWEKDAAVFKSGQVNINEEDFTDSHGKVHTIITKKSLYKEVFGLAFLVGIIREVTELKEAQNKLGEAYFELQQAQRELVQSEKLAALGRFSTGLAHEIKNPLAIILGGIEYLQSQYELAGENVKEVIVNIKAATLRADNILCGLLKFARPSELVLEKIKPAEVINEALALLKYRLPLSNIAIEFQFSEPAIFIKVDKNQIQQALFNIIFNAAEAMPNGGKIFIKVYSSIMHEVSAVEKMCVIEIVDSGEGISLEDMPRVFEPFYTTKREKKGSGLGLSMSKSIINKHKGELLLDSQLGQGTTVKIILPLV